jgi:hypothetical protein
LSFGWLSSIFFAGTPFFIAVSFAVRGPFSPFAQVS